LRIARKGETVSIKAVLKGVGWVDKKKKK